MSGVEEHNMAAKTAGGTGSSDSVAPPIVRVCSTFCFMRCCALREIALKFLLFADDERVAPPKPSTRCSVVLLGAIALP